MSRTDRARPAATAVLALLLLGLSACATPFEARVTRFHAPGELTPGRSFVVRPVDAGRASSLEFATYAARVSQNLIAQGFREAAPGTEADLVARLSYGIGPPRDRLGTRPGPAWSAWGWYGRPWWGPGWHPWIGSRFYDPFWGPVWGPEEVYSFTEFPAFAEVDIAPANGTRNLFEGRAETAARRPDMPSVVPKLIDAIFVDFPGVSGENRRVRIREAAR